MCIEVYLEVFRIIRALYPRAQIAVQTSTLQRDADDEKLIRDFAALDVDVRMDDENEENATRDVIHALTEMATADILFVSHSTFPYVAGLLNPNCVINTYQLGLTLDSWLDYSASDDRGSKGGGGRNQTALTRYLQDCVGKERALRQPHLSCARRR